MDKIANFSLLSLVVSGALLGTSSILKADKCADCTTTFNTCMKNCSEYKCVARCTADFGVCKLSFCPDLYAVRNASNYEMNFFRANGTLIGTLGKVSPNRLDVKESDFPITAAYAPDCPNLKKDPKCTTDNKYSYVIKTKGCYIVWYANGFYTTSLACRKESTLKTTDHTESPSPAVPQNKKSTH